MSERTELIDIISEVDGNEQSEKTKNEGTYIMINVTMKLLLSHSTKFKCGQYSMFSHSTNCSRQ